jgi:hypothetical protein
MSKTPAESYAEWLEEQEKRIMKEEARREGDR